MKATQSTTQQVNPIKKQHEGQLKQLIQQYFLEVGTEMWPIMQTVLDLKHTSKQSTNLNEEKIRQKKKKIQCGKIILLSTLAALLCTMVGLFQYEVVLVFGLFWGFVFTKYEVKMERQLTEMLLFWMIFALTTSLQDLLKLSLFFMPFYHSLKLFFIICLLYPKINFKSTICKGYFLPRITILSQTLSMQK